MAAKRKPQKRGKVGVQIFEQVERLVAEHKIGRTEAFKRLAAKTGRQQGTIAANYYRIAKQRGAKIAPRRRRGAGTGSTSAIVRRALAAMEEASTLFRKLEAEIAQLRKENLRLAAIRRLIGR